MTWVKYRFVDLSPPLTAGIYSIVAETNGERPYQVDVPDSPDESDFGPLDEAAESSLIVCSGNFLALPKASAALLGRTYEPLVTDTLAGTETQQFSPASRLQADLIVATVSLPLITTRTDYLHDVREAAGSAKHTVVVTVVSTVHVAPATPTTPTTHPAATTSTPQVEETPPATPSMTGLMYCLDPERSPVWTPCPLVHASGPNMVDASEVPGSEASISAGELGALNPLTAVRVGIYGLWKSAKAGVAGPYNSRRTMYMRRNGDGLDHLESNNLKERNRALYKGLQSALELLKMQHKLVKEQRVLINEQQRVMEEQRLNAEEQGLLFSRLRPATDCMAASNEDGQL